MLHCKTEYAAMQTNPLFLASGIRKYRPRAKRSDPLYCNQGTPMSKTASLDLVPSTTFFGRLMATIDRLLMASARIANRNGDLPYFGL
jgi:hypothetical protein